MLRLTPDFKVYLAPGVTDMRNNIDGLALKVEKQLKLDPFENSLFVFCNRTRDKLKILYWDRNGFWLYYRRLEEGRFNWPDGRGTAITITEQQLSWLLDGLSINQRSAHKEVTKRKLL